MAGNKQTRIVDVRVTSNVGKTMKKGTTQAKGLSGALKGVQASAMAATGGIRTMTAALLSSGIGAVVVAIGSLIGGMTSLVRNSMEFDKAFSNLAAVTGKSKDEIQALKENAKTLGATTAFTATQVLELSTEFAKLGFSTSEILNASEATLDLAAAAGVDLAEAATVAGSTLRGFGLDTEESQRVVDVMAKSFTSSALDMDKFKESMKLVAPIAKTTKVSIEESAAALSVLADRGVSGSMAGTQLRRVMSDLATKTGKNFQDSLELTAEKLEAAESTAEKLAIAKELVGDRAKGSLIALAENREEVIRLTTAYNNAGGAAEEMADAKLDNLEGSLTLLSSAWNGLMLSIEDGTGFLGGTVKFVIDSLTETITDLTNTSTALGFAWDGIMTFFKSIPTRLKVIGLDLEEFGLKARILAEDIPFWGNGEDKARLEGQLASVREAQAKALEDLSEFQKAQDESYMKAYLAYQGIKMKEAEVDEEVNKKKKQINDEFVEGSTGDDEENKKALEDRKAFLEKLRDLERNEQAKTEAEKIEARRAKHLEELAELELNTTEKRELEKRINKIYDDQKKENELRQAAELKEQLDAFRAQNQISDEEREIMENEIKEEKFIAQLEKLGADEAQINQIKEQFRIQRKAINDKYDEQEKEGERQKMAAIVDMTSSNLGSLANIATAFAGKSEKSQKKAFEISKKLRMAQAVVGGINAVQSAYAHGNTLGGPILGAVQAAIAAAVTAANVAAISKTTFQGAGRGNSNTSSGAQAVQPQAPSFNVIGQTSAGDNMIAETIGQANSQPTRAYVVESDVSSTQELARKADNLASIG